MPADQNDVSGRVNDTVFAAADTRGSRATWLGYEGHSGGRSCAVGMICQLVQPE